MEKRIRIDYRVYTLSTLLLAFGLRVYRLAHQSYWWDEIAAAAMAVLPLKDTMDTLLAVRNHVPLYFFLARAWSPVGHGEFALRFLSTIWGVVGVSLIYAVGRLVGNPKVGLGAAFLLAISPFHIWYSQEARMYTMVSTCVLMASWFFVRLLRRDHWRDWVGYGLSMLVAVYTHYLAVFVVLAHYVFLSLHYRLLRRTFLRWLVCVGIVLSIFGIWILVMMHYGGFAGAPIGWIAPAHWYEPALTLFVFAGGTAIASNQVVGYLSLFVCLAAISLCAIRPIRQQIVASMSPAQSLAAPIQSQPNRHLSIKMFLYWLAVPLLITWAISLDLPIPNKRSIYMDRYVLVVLPAFVLLVVYGLTYVSGKGKRWIAIVVWGCLIACAAQSLSRFYFDPAYERDNWRAAIDHLESVGSTDAVVLLRPSHTLPLAYYADESIPYRELPFLFYEHEREAFLEQGIEPFMDEITAKWSHAWLISSVDNTNPHGFPQERNAELLRVGDSDAVKAWLDGRYRVLDEQLFSGVLLTLYDLSVG